MKKQTQKDKEFIDKIKTIGINTGSGKKVKHHPLCPVGQAAEGYSCELKHVATLEFHPTCRNNPDEQSFSA